MSDTPTTPETPATPEAPEAPKQETFSRDYVETLRQEAANHRNKAKTAADEARAEVIAEYEGKLAEKDTAHAELETSFKAASVELARLKAVIEAEIPTEDIVTVAGLVQGEDDETISESVKRVKEIYGRGPAKDRPVDPSQGQGSTIPLNGDPIVNMMRAAVRG